MDRKNKFEITETANRQWLVRKGGVPMGHVNLTKGGFYRAYNYRAGSGVGPIFSFLRAVRFTTKGIYQVSLEDRCKGKGGAWVGRTGEPDWKVWFPNVKGAEKYLGDYIARTDPVGLDRGDYYIDDMSEKA